MFKLLIPLLLILSNVGQAADMVVIHSNVVQAFHEGQLLDSSIPINLAKLSKITVVFANGEVKTINGPYQGKLTQPFSVHKADPNLVVTLADLILNRKNKIVRGNQQPAKDIWLIDVSTSKRYYCIEPTQSAILWRPQSQGASTVLIKHKRTSAEIEAKWPARKMTIGWPSPLPIFYGDTYTIEITNRNHSVFKKLVLYQLPNLPTNSHKVVWMVGRGCIPQANLLLASLR